MDGLTIGIDLCDTYTQVNAMDDEKTWTFPTVICRNRNSEEWYVGEEAFAHTLKGDGIIVDKLLNLVLKDGTATLGGIKYEARQLFIRFLDMALELPKKEYGTQAISSLAIAVRRLDSRIIQILRQCIHSLGIGDAQVNIISHAEAFIYETLSQRRDVWSGTVGMFDLSEEGFRYYELKVQRGLKQSVVVAEYEEMEDEGFHLDILDTPSGAKLGDKIVCSCAQRVMQKKLYSSVFLCGKGFLDRGWAEEFMKMLSSSRRVFLESAVFAKGAACRAADVLREKTAFPYICICDGRLRTTVLMNVLHKGQETSVILASAGDSWYDRRAVVDVIPDNQDFIEFWLVPADMQKKRLVTVPLEGFPVRTDRTMRVRMFVSFLDGMTMDVRLKDQGFGELFAPSGAQIRQEVRL